MALNMNMNFLIGILVALAVILAGVSPFLKTLLLEALFLDRYK